MVCPVIYISVSDDRRHLTIDGHLVLLSQFLVAIRAGEEGKPSNQRTEITKAAQLKQQGQGMQHD